MKQIISTVVVLAVLAMSAVWLHAQHEHAGPQELLAVLRPTKGSKVAGNITFTQEGKGVRVKGNVRNLTPNGKHAIHIHEFGDPRGTDGTAAGGHYNPEGHPHALPEKAERHAGDLGNLEANDEGVARINLVVDNISLVGPKNPIIGRGVIVHEKVDDGGQPTGNAGGRIAVGVIGIGNPKYEAPKKEKK